MNVFPLNELTVALESELNYEYNNDYTELFDISYNHDRKWFDFEIVMINAYINNENDKKRLYTVEKGYTTELKYIIKCDKEVDYDELESIYHNDNSEKDWQTVAMFDNYDKALEYCHTILQVDTLRNQLNKDDYTLI